RYLDCAALEDTSLGHRDLGKASRTFRNRCLTVVERQNETTAEFGNFGERVWLAALVDYADNRSFLDLQRVWLEIPVGVGSSSRGLGQQVGECGGCPQGNVLAEVSPQRRIKSGRVAFVQGYDLRNPRCIIVPRVVVRLPLRQ